MVVFTGTLLKPNQTILQDKMIIWHCDINFIFLDYLAIFGSHDAAMGITSLQDKRQRTGAPKVLDHKCRSRQIIWHASR